MENPACNYRQWLYTASNYALLLVGALCILSCVVQAVDSGDTFTDQWAVHIEGGDQKADEIAHRQGFTNLGKIFEDYYHFEHRRVAKRSADPSLVHDKNLVNEPEVKWARQQVVKSRVKRDLIETDSAREERARERVGRPSRKAALNSSLKARSVTVSLNDPRWSQMWYLNRGMGWDMNVQEAWAEGVTGKGVVVTILDDGLEKDHPDIRRNYDPQASYDVNGHDDDPMPRYDLIDSNRHGTRCAGEVAAEGNNSICAVGVAFDAGIGGVRMLDGDVTDAVEARSLSLNPQHIDIYSASWGPDDDGKTVDGPGELATRAFIEGVTKGRGGKGSIFVWASGNGGRDHDNCNCDGYTNSIWTLSISSATENGYVPWYSEACSSTLATTYSSGSSGEKQIVTTDLHHSCTASHTGTSASAPLAAGICALALEANRNLTWRDMQHIVVRTAKPANLKADDWQVNGVGRNVSHSFGYGLMDAAAMVKAARSWNSVPPQQLCEIRAPDSNKLIPAKNQLQIQLNVSECSGVNFIEHVQARITLAAVSRGDIQIMLSSPSGTRSTLLALRPHDSSRNGFHSWPFMSVHYWGESPFGVWTLEIQNEGRYLATLSEWNVVIYGTKDAPDAKNRAATVQKQQQQPTPTVVVAHAEEEKHLPKSIQTGADQQDAAAVTTAKPSVHTSDEENRTPVFSSPESVPVVSSAATRCLPGQWDSTAAVCLTCESGYYLWQGQCVASCPASSIAANHTMLLGVQSGHCIPCHYTCLTCSGPNDSECTSCRADAVLRSISTPGIAGPTEHLCHPKVVVGQLIAYERWALGVELALALNVALVAALCVYMLCNRNGCNTSCSLSCCRRGNRSKINYQNLTASTNKKNSMIDAQYSNNVPSTVIEASVTSDEEM